VCSLSFISFFFNSNHAIHLSFPLNCQLPAGYAGRRRQDPVSFRHLPGQRLQTSARRAGPTSDFTPHLLALWRDNRACRPDHGKGPPRSGARGLHRADTHSNQPIDAPARGSRSHLFGAFVLVQSDDLTLTSLSPSLPLQFFHLSLPKNVRDAKVFLMDATVASGAAGMSLGGMKYYEVLTVLPPSTR
jgi:hypothetical protein